MTPLPPVALAALFVLEAACGRAPAPEATASDDAIATEAAEEATEPATLLAGPNRRPAEAEGRAPEQSAGEDAPRGEYETLMIRGEAALYSGRFEDARVAYLEAMELRPENTAPALGALRSMAIEGHAEARVGITERIELQIARYTERPETRGAAYLLSARLALALGDPGGALDEARMAVQHMPELGVGWRVLGEAAMAAELWGEAVDALKTALDLGLQAESGTWERLADAFDELGEVDAAVEAAKQALAMTGTDPHARRRRLNLLAVVRKHAGDLEGAVETAERARLLGPDDPAVLHNLGAIAQAQRKPEEALALWERATDAVPVPMTLWRMGKLLLELDRPNDALRAFSRSAANLTRWTWPDSERWLPAYEAGKLYARAGQYRRAIGWFEDALREARTAPATREIISWLAFTRTQAVDDTAEGP